MKPKFIILIALLAVAIAVILSTYGDVSTTATFTEADKNPEREYHITGKLRKDKPIEYNPKEDANYFSFYLEDKDGVVKKVISHEPKLQDFELTETVSMIGMSEGENFRAKKVLPKCPSKYKDEQQAQEAQQAKSI